MPAARRGHFEVSHEMLFILKFNSSSQNFLFVSCIIKFHYLKFRNAAVIVTSLC